MNVILIFDTVSGTYVNYKCVPVKGNLKPVVFNTIGSAKTKITACFEFQQRKKDLEIHSFNLNQILPEVICVNGEGK